MKILPDETRYYVLVLSPEENVKVRPYTFTLWMSWTSLNLKKSLLLSETTK